MKLKLTQNNIKFETQSNDGVRNITQKLQLLSLKPRESTKRTLKELQKIQLYFNKLYAQEQEESHNKFTAQKFDLTKQAREEAKFLKGTNYDMIPLSKNQSYLNDPQITKQRMNINPFTRLLKQEEDQRKNSLQENSITKSENLRNPFIQNPDIQQLSSYHQRDSQSSQFTQKKSPGTSQGGFSFNMKPSGSIQTLGMNEQAEMQFRDQYQRYLQDQKNSEKYAQQNNSTSQLSIHRQQKESKAQGFSHQNLKQNFLKSFLFKNYQILQQKLKTLQFLCIFFFLHKRAIKFGFLITTMCQRIIIWIIDQKKLCLTTCQEQLSLTCQKKL